MIYETLSNNGLTQHVTEKTRFYREYENNDNILDIVLTSEADYIHDKAGPVDVFPRDFSDHYPIVFEVQSFLDIVFLEIVTFLDIVTFLVLTDFLCTKLA